MVIMVIVNSHLIFPISCFTLSLFSYIASQRGSKSSTLKWLRIISDDCESHSALLPVVAARNRKNGATQIDNLKEDERMELWKTRRVEVAVKDVVSTSRKSKTIFRMSSVNVVVKLIIIQIDIQSGREAHILQLSKFYIYSLLFLAWWQVMGNLQKCNIDSQARPAHWSF